MSMYRKLLFLIISIVSIILLACFPNNPVNAKLIQPGVYVEEIPNSQRVITGVSTTNTVFIGKADQGLTGKAVLITGWNQYVNQFGGSSNNGYLGCSIYAYFQEGGMRCYVIRVPDGAPLAMGLSALDAIRDVNLIAIPDWAGDPAAMAATLTYCQRRKTCFLIADPPAGSSPDDVIRFKTGNSALKSSYGAIYYPWVMVSGPAPGQKRLIPPSGSVAGRYVYTDTTRGVHKAPAGADNGRLKLTTAFETILNTQDASRLNVAGINPIINNAGRFFIQGARTLSQDPEWKYLSIRRLQIYIEQSIRTSLEWAVFEPSGPPLWSRVQQSIDSFLMQLWRKGAFMGNKAEDAFFVKVDAENNPPATVSQGKLNITLGFAPLKPAEFIITNISLNTK